MIKITRFVFLIIIPFLWGSLTFATGKVPLAITELEKLEKLNDMDRKAEDMDKAAKRLGDQFLMMCLRSFGHSAFCQCLRENRPFWLEYFPYIQATAMTKEQLKYSELSKDLKESIDASLQVREKCVKLHFLKSK